MLLPISNWDSGPGLECDKWVPAVELGMVGTTQHCLWSTGREDWSELSELTQWDMAQMIEEDLALGTDCDTYLQKPNRACGQRVVVQEELHSFKYGLIITEGPPAPQPA